MWGQAQGEYNSAEMECLSIRLGEYSGHFVVAEEVLEELKKPDKVLR